MQNKKQRKFELCKQKKDKWHQNDIIATSSIDMMKEKENVKNKRRVER
jgi:hypothetical protein